MADTQQSALTYHRERLKLAVYHSTPLLYAKRPKLPSKKSRFTTLFLVMVTAKDTGCTFRQRLLLGVNPAGMDFEPAS